MSANNPKTIPLALSWQVANEGRARAHLGDVIKKLGLNQQVTRHQAGDLTTYDSARGTGYAVRKGWAIVSLSIKDTLAKLSVPPSTNLSSNAVYNELHPPTLCLAPSFTSTEISSGELLKAPSCPL
jgi:hypothetical protein